MDLPLARHIARDLGLCRGIYWLYPPASAWKAVDFARVKACWSKALGPHAPHPTDLHINIPFCRKEARYCDFIHVVESRPAEYDLYLACMKRELDLLGLPPKARFRRLFFTGGSATVLSPAQIRRVFKDILRGLQIDSPDAAIEIGHGPAPAQSLKEFADHGVRRAILGVQSLDPALFRRLRSTQDKDSLRAMASAIRSAGIPRLRINMTAGFPGQSMESFAGDLGVVLGLHPDSVILTPFTPAPYPPLYQALPLRGPVPKLGLTPEEVVRRAAMVALGNRMVAQAGLSSSPDGDKEWCGEYGSQLCLGFGSLSRIRRGLIYRNGIRYREYRKRLRRGMPPPVVGYPMNLDREMRAYAIWQLECPGFLRKDEFRQLFGRDAEREFMRETESLSAVSPNGKGPLDLTALSPLGRAVLAKYFYEPSLAEPFRKACGENKGSDRLNRQLLQLYRF